jgi:enamine deaminase RidA (YjgF/YER057c/UK114 family)
MSGNIRFLNPKELDKPPGYTPVVEMTGPGRVIYVAGQLGVSGGKLVGGPGDFRAQCVKAFENVKIALAEVGAEFRHVVKMNNYLTDMRHLSVLREVRDTFLNTAAPPASTTIETPKLAREGAMFEVEVIAVLPPH